GILKIEMQEIFGDSLNQDIKAELSAVQFHSGIGRAGGGHTSFSKHLAAENLVHEAGILNLVVEVDLFQSMNALSFSEFVEFQGESRLGVQTSETASPAFEVHAHISEQHAIDFNVYLDKDARLAFKLMQAILQSQDAEARNHTLFKEIFRGNVFCRFVRRGRRLGHRRLLNRSGICESC